MIESKVIEPFPSCREFTSTESIISLSLWQHLKWTGTGHVRVSPSSDHYTEEQYDISNLPVHEVSKLSLNITKVCCEELLLSVEMQPRTESIIAASLYKE